MRVTKTILAAHVFGKIGPYDLAEGDSSRRANADDSTDQLVGRAIEWKVV